MVTEAIKPGYKKTEIGVIPEDWEVKQFSKVSFMKGRIGWQGLKQSEFTMNSDEPFLITGMNFKDGEIRWDEAYHVAFKRYEIAKEIQLKVKDVLMTKDGTIGKLLYVTNIPYPGKATLNSHLLVFRPIKKSYVPKYLYYNLSSRYFKNHIEISKYGTTFFGISQEAVGEYGLLLPPYEEQEAIDKTITETDELIQQLAKLISKKKDIKKGTMQELLTGKKRLPGFNDSQNKNRYKKTELGTIPEDWDARELNECLISKPEYGIGASATSYSDILPTYLRITDISDDGYFIKDGKVSVDHPDSSKYILHKGDIVLARTGASVGKSYLYKQSDGILVFAGFLIKITPDPSKLNPIFLREYLRTKQYWGWVNIMSTRTG